MAEADRDDLISIIEDDNTDAEIPGILPLMPVRDVVVFPDMVLPLFVGREKSVRAVEEAVAKTNAPPLLLRSCGCHGVGPPWARHL